MKIRIKGASIRIRLSRSEVDRITTTGALEERTPFGDHEFVYALERASEGDELSATFDGGRITMYVPETRIRGWATNDLISIESHAGIGPGQKLHLLLEKDFQCIDQTSEDQSDNYINPNKNC